MLGNFQTMVGPHTIHSKFQGISFYRDDVQCAIYIMCGGRRTNGILYRMSHRGHTHSYIVSLFLINFSSYRKLKFITKVVNAGWLDNG